MKSSRIVVPSAMRLQVLDKVHEGHQGIAKCRDRAKASIWWPGLSRFKTWSRIARFVLNTDNCRPSQ